MRGNITPQLLKINQPNTTMKSFMIRVLQPNNNFRTIGYCKGENRERVVEKLGLFPTGSTWTGLQIPMRDKRNFATIYLQEIRITLDPMLENCEQVLDAIGTEDVKLWEPMPPQNSIWKKEENA